MNKKHVAVAITCVVVLLYVIGCSVKKFTVDVEDANLQRQHTIIPVQ